MLSVENSVYTEDQLTRIRNLGKNNARTVNLLANGFLVKDIARDSGRAISTIKNSLTELRRSIRLNDVMQLSLFWYRSGNFSLNGLDRAVDFGQFGTLSAREKAIMNALVGGRGSSNKEIALELDMALSTVKNNLGAISNLVHRGNLSVNRCALGVGYEIYKGRRRSPR